MDPKKALFQVVAIAVLVIAGIAFLFLRQQIPGVEARFDPLPVQLGTDQELTLDLTAQRGGVQRVRVQLVQADREITLYEAEFDSSGTNHRRVAFQIKPGTQGAREGEGRLEVWSSDGFWRLKPVDSEPVLSIPVNVDLTPPGLDLLSFTRYTSQGGAGVAVLRSRDSETVGVQVGQFFHRGYPTGDPQAGLHLAYFAIPFDHPADEAPSALALDAAGNRRSQSVGTVIAKREYRHGKVTLDSSFLAEKLPELLPERGEIPPEEFGEAFRYVSTVLRGRAEATKVRLGQRSAPRALWEGAFLQPRNTRVFSNYAETRDYSYEGVALDTKVHAGFDLASTARAPIPAAARGRVVFAADLGIYGQTVVLDHGLGLQTLYSHLSEFAVQVDEDVERGQTLGRSGKTGLAVGDHLHYEVLIHGIPVNPMEWWDAKWIEAKVYEVMGDAGLTTAP